MSHLAPIVVVTLPPGAGEGAQVAVHHYDFGIEVDIRTEQGAGWLPIALAGGSFVVEAVQS